jgi:predicted RNA-binding protein with TRAM domain
LRAKIKPEGPRSEGQGRARIDRWVVFWQIAAGAVAGRQVKVKGDQAALQAELDRIPTYFTIAKL